MSSVQLSLGTWRVSIGRTDPAPSEIHRLYDGTWQWHAMVALLGYRRAYVRLFRRLAGEGWLGHSPLRVLDCGIGTGWFSLALAQAVSNRLEIHGVDLSPRMVVRARANLRRHLPSVPEDIRLGDIHGLDYAAERFDLVMAAHVIEHSPQPAAALREMVRVLRPGAPLLFATMRASCANAVHGLFWRYQSIGADRLAGLMEAAGVTPVHRDELGPAWSPPGWCSEIVIGRKARGGASPPGPRSRARRTRGLETPPGTRSGAAPALPGGGATAPSRLGAAEPMPGPVFSQPHHHQPS